MFTVVTHLVLPPRPSSPVVVSSSRFLSRRKFGRLLVALEGKVHVGLLGGQICRFPSE
jgi:hypothetical protein